MLIGTAALIRHIVDDNAANAEVVSAWIEKWSPLASEALEAFASVTAEAPVPLDPGAAAARITDEVSRELGAALKR
jgi:toluene monooxygenase system protein E